jgi:hypothetical protein
MTRKKKNNLGSSLTTTSYFIAEKIYIGKMRSEHRTLLKLQSSVFSCMVFAENKYSMLPKNIFSSVKPEPGFGIQNLNQRPISVLVSESKFLFSKPKLSLSNFSYIFQFFFRDMRF